MGMYLYAKLKTFFVGFLCRFEDWSDGTHMEILGFSIYDVFSML